MESYTKKEIGNRLRKKREACGYSREKLGELCALSPRFIANIEFGDATFSMDSLMAVCRVLSCSSDYLLFGDVAEPWKDIYNQLIHFDIRYKQPVEQVLRVLMDTFSDLNTNEPPTDSHAS